MQQERDGRRKNLERWPQGALREAKLERFQIRGFPTFFGKGPDGVAYPFFLINAVHRPRKRERTNRENPRKTLENPLKNRGSPGGNPGKIGTGRKRKKEKGRTSPDREPPIFETPCLFGGLERRRGETMGSCSNLSDLWARMPRRLCGLFCLDANPKYPSVLKIGEQKRHIKLFRNQKRA